jgi:hypothetical protein
MAVVSSVLSASDITSLIQQASAKFMAPANTLQAQEKPLQPAIGIRRSRGRPDPSAALGHDVAQRHRQSDCNQ